MRINLKNAIDKMGKSQLTCGLLFALALYSSTPTRAQLPYQDYNLSSEERATDLISRLTIEEKAALMCDVSDAIPRLGIKKFNWWSEALHGLANNSDVTVFPEPIGMAASFDDQLVYKIFSATSDEVRAKYQQALRDGKENKRFLSLSVWTPNVNIFRDPRWGRGQETYDEDPYLTIKFGGLRNFDITPFQTVLVDELIPYVDNNFRTIADQPHRAMAGLSMGGMETRTVTMNKPEVFSHYALLSGGLYKPEDIKDRSKVKLIFLSCGSKERPDGVKSAAAALKDAGFNAYSYYIRRYRS